MIALALLFIVIIGLLSVIVWLLHKYFEAYTNLYTQELYQANELQSRVAIQQKKSDILGREDEINTIINERLTELEQKFPTSHDVEEHPQEEAAVS